MESVGIHCYKGGSGKSTTAIGLAAETARSGKKVLLVDGDFGVPAQAITLKADAALTGNDAGLADFYIGHANLEKIIRSPNLSRLQREFPEADMQGIDNLFVIPPGDEALIEHRHDIDFGGRMRTLLSEAAALGFQYVFVDCRGGSHGYSTQSMLNIDHRIVVGNDKEVEVRGIVRTLESYRRHALRGLFGNSPVRLSQFVEKVAYECAMSKVKGLKEEQQEPLVRALQENFSVSKSKVRDVLTATLKEIYLQQNPGKELNELQENELMYCAIRLLPRSTEEYLQFAETVARNEQEKGMKTDYNKVLEVMKYFAENSAGVIITRVRNDSVAGTAFDRVQRLANSEGLGVRYVGFFPESKDAKDFHYFLQHAFVNGTEGKIDDLLARPETHKNLGRVDVIKLKRQFDLAYGG